MDQPSTEKTYKDLPLGTLKIEDFPEHFFEEETRCGYTIPAEMKQVWAVELDLAAKLLEVCKKHNLRIWCDSGTLLGAIRHGGYIPWDDDIDFVMLRDDYDKLVKIADKEFSGIYFLQNTYSDHHVFGFSKLRNNATYVKQPRLDGIKMNRGIFVDIFVLDGFVENPVKRFLHRTWSVIVKDTLRYAVYPFGYKHPYTKFWLAAISKFMYLFIPKRKAFSYYEKIMRSVPVDKSERIAQLSFRYSTHHWLRRREYYDDQPEWMQFEGFLPMPIPTHAHEVLRDHFGNDYMTPRQLPTYHGEIYFDPFTPQNGGKH